MGFGWPSSSNSVSLLIYDAQNVVKYTDIDYVVFTDAARNVWNGGSPYDRHTYRYTPLIAWMLVPNVTVTPLFGKLVFSSCDVLIGYLIYEILRAMPSKLASQTNEMAKMSAILWLYFPLTVNICTRGSAESIIIVLVLLTLLLYQRKRYFATGLMLGISIHFKMYPVIFSLPLYTALQDERMRKTTSNWVTKQLMPNSARIRLVIGTTMTFVGLTGICYFAYGWKFLNDTYLHHISRIDIRHNFSVYNYLLYLTSGSDNIGIKLLAFLPQVILMLGITQRFGNDPNDIPFCLFAQTFVFVTYNKIVELQYFLWYANLSLLIYQRFFSTAKFAGIVVTWTAIIVTGMRSMFVLKNQGENSYLNIWLWNQLLFIVNICILASFVMNYREQTAPIRKTEKKMKYNKSA